MSEAPTISERVADANDLLAAEDAYSKSVAIDEVATLATEVLDTSEPHVSPGEKKQSPWDMVVVYRLGKSALEQAESLNPESVDETAIGILREFVGAVDQEIDRRKQQRDESKVLAALAELPSSEYGHEAIDEADRLGVRLTPKELIERASEALDSPVLLSPQELVKLAITDRLEGAFKKYTAAEAIDQRWRNRESFKRLLENMTPEQRDDIVQDLSARVRKSDKQGFRDFVSGIAIEFMVQDRLQELVKQGKIQSFEPSQLDEDVHGSTDFFVVTNRGEQLRVDAKARGGMMEAGVRPPKRFAKVRNRQGRPVLVVNPDGGAEYESISGVSPKDEFHSFTTTKDGRRLKQFDEELAALLA